MIEINLTPNRPDCTGVHGIARDLAAADIGTFKDAAIKPIKGEFPCPVAVTLDFGQTHRFARPSRCASCAASRTARRRNGCRSG